MTGSLEALLAPQSVAVIGASDEPARIGGRPIYQMLKAGFAGRIYPVNPRRRTVQGLRCYPDIASVPEPVDCAVVSVPAPVAVEVIAGCAEAGARSAVVFTSGFAETGASGSRAQQQIAGIARTSGMRIVGPNCLGIFNLEVGWFGTFANSLASRKLPCGPIGIITQSGAYGGHLFTITQNRGVGSTYWVTTGNECDVDVAEVISCYAAIDSVRVIVAYAEGIGDGDRLRQAFADARAARKPVIFMKVGMTEAGARAAASHTASLAGSDSIYDGLFAQYGVWRAETTEEMADIAYAAQFDRFPNGNRISLQTISGGVGVQLADAASRRGFEVTPMPEATRAKMLKVIPFGGVNNPVDFTGQALNDRTILERCMELTVEEGGYHSHIIYIASLAASPFTRDLSLSVFRHLRERYPDELFLMSLIAPEEIRRQYEEMGLPLLRGPFACGPGNGGTAPLQPDVRTRRTPAGCGAAGRRPAGSGRHGRRAGRPRLPGLGRNPGGRGCAGGDRGCRGGSLARDRRAGRPQDRLTRHHPQDRDRRCPARPRRRGRGAHRLCHPA